MFITLRQPFAGRSDVLEPSRFHRCSSLFGPETLIFVPVSPLRSLARLDLAILAPDFATLGSSSPLRGLAYLDFLVLASGPLVDSEFHEAN